jgi:NitT/TauT family transport system ATP-binding protein
MRGGPRRPPRMPSPTLVTETELTMGGAVAERQGSAIVVERASKIFALEGKEFVALEDVSFSVREGEFVAIIGPSGCGKSTLLRMIADVIPATRGAISIGGGSPADARRARRIGLVFQEPVLLPWRTALENIELPLVIAGVRAGERRRRARDYLRLVGLEGFESAPPAALSGGMARRVGIARALVLEPEILLLDEPFGALDEITRQRMNGELLRIWSETGTTAILVTHNVGEAVYLSDRVLVMGTQPGRIVAEVAVELPRPRSLELLEDPEFFRYTSRLSHHLLSTTDEHRR